MFRCLNKMESEDQGPKRTVRELSKFYVGKANEASKFDGSDLLQNQTADTGYLTPRNDDFSYLDGNATLPRTSFVTKSIKVDSQSELMMLTRNHAVRNLISNLPSSINVQPPKVPSSKSNKPQIISGLSDDSDSSDFDSHADGYAEVVFTSAEDRGSSEYDNILGFNANKVTSDEIPSSSYEKSQTYDIVIRRDTFVETPAPLSVSKTREKNHRDATWEKDSSMENLVISRDVDKRNSASLLTIKYPPTQESAYDVVLKAESPRGNPSPLSEKLKAQIEEKLKVEKPRLISSGVHNDRMTKAGLTLHEALALIEDVNFEYPEADMVMLPPGDAEETEEDSGDEEKMLPGNSGKSQSLIFQDLIEVEQRYLERLKHVIDNYLMHFRSVRISARIEFIFGNIEKLYDEVKKLFVELKQCNSIDDVANAFINNVNVFDHYAGFLANKSVANQWFTKTFGQLIKDRERELQDNNTFESYFVEPIQKPGGYLLFLINLQAETRKTHQLTEKLDEAVALVEKKIKEMNTKLAVDCIQCCPIYLCKMGGFIMKGIFRTSLDEETAIFLFEECIVFCVQDRENSDRYNYICHINTSNASLRHSERPTGFELSSSNKAMPPSIRNQFEIHIEANTKESKQTWVKEIEKLLRNPLQDSDEEYDELLRRHDKFASIFFDRSLGPSRDNDKSEYVEILNLLPEQASLLKELIKTEELYLKGLKRFIEDFYTYPESMSSYKYLLVNNIEDIYNESEKLYTRLLNCNSPETIAKAFFESEGVFDACTAYIRNKSAYDFVYTELKKVQQDASDLENGKKWIDSLLNLLLKPAKYKTFLEKQQSLSTKANQHCQLLNDSIKFINRKINQAVTQMNIDAIQRCPFDLSDKGPLLKKGAFQIENKCDCTLFLFRDMVVFCLRDQFHPETYLYFDSIDVDRLMVTDCGNNKFQLKSSHTSKIGKQIGYTFNMVASSMAVKQQWFEEIERLTAPRT